MRTFCPPTGGRLDTLPNQGGEVLIELTIMFWVAMAVLGMVIANAKNRSLAEGFFLSLLCGCFGVLIVALLPKQLPKAPRGLTAVLCPRCSAAQNVPYPADYECWQCHHQVTPAVEPIPVKPTAKKVVTTCPHCQQRLKVSATSTSKRFKCFKCGGFGQMPVRAE